MTQKHTPNRPQYPEPYWRDSVDLPKFNKLSNDIKVDVAIVGGGISGITTAYLLGKEGLKVALIEAGNILNGTTGHTTAKITAQHDLIYDEFIHHLGEERAKLYYKANIDAFHFIKQTTEQNQINCDFSEEDAYIYATSDSYVRKLHTEYQAYQKLGIDSEYIKTIPLDIPIKAAIVMKKQAQFHPLKYLANLVKHITNAGGMIYENTTAVDVEEGTQPKVITRDGHNITCDFVVSGSHFPFYDKGFYFTRMYADRSYVLGVKTEEEYPGGMYLSAEEPKRSLRYTTTINREKLVLIGGEGHKTGQGICTMKHYEALESFGDQILGIKEYAYRWSTQDLITLDKVPYVGHITSGRPNVLVATGYRKWGMTNGTAAAMLLRDIIMRRSNPYQELYSPSRFYADPSIKHFIVENADVAGHFIAGKVDLIHKKIEELANDEGAVVFVNGQRSGAYKDDQGVVHLVDTTCTHLSCEVEWNHGDRTWDCPCHGSRFSITGDVIEGPANKPLKRIEV